MPETRESVELDLYFTKGQMQQIKCGILPERMENKWFIYYTDGKLYMHRSWTGICVYIGHFEDANDGAVLRLLEVNPESEFTTDDSVYQVKLFLFLIGLLLLDLYPKFPLRDGSEVEEAISAWAMVGRAYFKG